MVELEPLIIETEKIDESRYALLAFPDRARRNYRVRVCITIVVKTESPPHVNANRQGRVYCPNTTGSRNRKASELQTP